MHEPSLARVTELHEIESRTDALRSVKNPALDEDMVTLDAVHASPRVAYDEIHKAHTEWERDTPPHRRDPHMKGWFVLMLTAHNQRRARMSRSRRGREDA